MNRSPLLTLYGQLKN